MFDIKGSEPGDQGQGVQGLDLAQCGLWPLLNWPSVLSIKHALKRGVGFFCFMKTF